MDLKAFVAKPGYDAAYFNRYAEGRLNGPANCDTPNFGRWDGYGNAVGTAINVRFASIVEIKSNCISDLISLKLIDSH